MVSTLLPLSLPIPNKPPKVLFVLAIILRTSAVILKLFFDYICLNAPEKIS
jgi:hypothetical protein